ncbi:Udp-glycosyltransferase 73b3 [Thalictrum thalictroides]|uniref:Glycosyltransferase n=1 Tax=Thalictrum thalictroides TaxID=46969 RepID=A0A7J6W8E1_THATH|nr:Udp-glycosyltransferase 73b3 [Thalictrum thalictroides]
MMIEPFTDLLSEHLNGPDPPNCAIIDVMIPWAHQPCKQFNIPTISFFTSSACSASVEFAIDKLSPDNLTAGDLLPRLPEFIRVSLTDMIHWAPPPHHHSQLEPMSGPPPRSGPGRQPSWVSETESSIALLINTWDDLERPCVDYLRKEVKKPIFCVGPLLPEEFSKTVGSTVQDSVMRSKRDQSTYSEKEINEWLDTKPRGSVIYVAFGSEVGPSKDELADLAVALDECNRPFIWVIQSGPNRHGPRPSRGPHGGPTRPPKSTNMDMDLDGFVERVKGRGLILCGWAPQLLILSHSSTGGFISHGGWNSTLEAILRGVPLLTWPIRGDQHYNAKLIMEHFKVGLIIKGDDNQIEGFKKDDILQGIEKLMVDENIRKHANLLANMFEHELSGSYKASLDAFNSFMNQIEIAREK